MAKKIRRIKKRISSTFLKMRKRKTNIKSRIAGKITRYALDRMQIFSPEVRKNTYFLIQKLYAANNPEEKRRIIDQLDRLIGTLQRWRLINYISKVAKGSTGYVELKDYRRIREKAERLGTTKAILSRHVAKIYAIIKDASSRVEMAEELIFGKESGKHFKGSGMHDTAISALEDILRQLDEMEKFRDDETVSTIMEPLWNQRIQFEKRLEKLIKAK